MIKRIFCILVALTLVSCAEVPLKPGRHDRGDKGRLLFYIHTDQKNVPHIEFTATSIEIQSGNGEWTTVVDEPFQVASIDVEKGQQFISEAIVAPGRYKALRVVFSAASRWSGDERASLSLPSPDGELVMPIGFELLERQSKVVNMEWKPVDSIRKRVTFEPHIKVEPDMPPPRALLLYVSNSGEDYITVIDKESERVVGALTVGGGPMGIAVNDTLDTLYVANSEDSTISVVDAVDYHLRETIILASSRGPSDIVFLPGSEAGRFGKLYVSSKSSTDVIVISTDGNEIIKHIPFDSSPVHMAVDTRRREVYVVDAILREISVISALTDTVVGTIKLGAIPYGIVVGDGKIYVLMEDARSISLVSPSRREVEEVIYSVRPPSRGMVGFDGTLFVMSRTEDKVLFFDENMMNYTEVGAGPGPVGVETDEVRERLYVTAYGGDALVVIDPVRESVVTRLKVGKEPYGVVSVEH